MCDVLYCGPEDFSAMFVSGPNNHRSDIACVTRMWEYICTVAPECGVNMGHGNGTDFRRCAANMELRDGHATMAARNLPTLAYHAALDLLEPPSTATHRHLPAAEFAPM